MTQFVKWFLKWLTTAVILQTTDKPKCFSSMTTETMYKTGLDPIADANGGQGSKPE